MDFHHFYTATATASDDGSVGIAVEGLESIESNAPKEFGGPGGLWSPEDLLIAAIADCYVLSFRAISKIAKFSWQNITCETTGELDRADTGVQFIAFKVTARLILDSEADAEQAQKLLKKAKSACFISNSVKAPVELVTEIVRR